MRGSVIIARATLGCVLVLGLGACRGETSTEPPIVPLRGMHEMPRYDVQEAAAYFEDGRSMRMPVEGTVAMEEEIDQEIAEGIRDDGTYVAQLPQAVLDRAGGMGALVERGQTRYNIYCAPCHSEVGDGHGMVSRRAEERGYTFAAANFHDDRIRHMPDGQVYATITNGIRTMPAYRAQVPVQDRWAIVAYVRALQLSQADARTASLGDSHSTGTEAVQ